MSPPELQRVIVGTAGHVDHGKTELIKALTGIDCDRWAEEKERGITIDLGFAHLADGELQVGFVDVPGHHRFLHNALAGLGGVRVMLLVVAADEGVMPQTREHVAICSLLGIPAALVALTKCDLVGDDVLELAELEVAELLESTPFAGAPVHPVSSLTGDGLPGLRSELLELARRNRVEADDDQPARLPIDRAFVLRGLGVVVTGTLASGVVRPGDALELAPAGVEVRVRSIQVHGAAREEARAGERTSLQITGVDLGQVERGQQLVTPGLFAPTRSLCVRLTLLPEVDKPLAPTEVRLHLYSQATPAQLRPLDPRPLPPGATGLAELRPHAPLLAVRGDRFIIRRLSPAATLGGGVVLDPGWRRRRGAALAGALEAVTGGEDEALVAWVHGRGERGAETPWLARRLGVRPQALDSPLAMLAAAGRLSAVDNPRGQGRWWLTPDVEERLAKRAARVLGGYLEKDRLARGMPRAEAVKRMLPAVPAALAQHFLERLVERGVLEVAGDLVAPPGHRVELAAAERRVADELLARLEAAGTTPPAETELKQQAGEAASFEAALRFLVEEGKLLRLPGGMVIATAAVDELRQELLAGGWERFSVPQFKERFGLTRKWAIPLLELFDSRGWTRRAGDDRLVVR